MSLEDLGNIGEFVAAVAVIVTLGYLAVQIRQNTRTVRASTHHGAIRLFNEQQVAFASDPAVSGLLLRGSEDYSQLDPDERFRYTLLMRSIIGVHYDLFVQYGESLLSEEAWATYRRQIPRNLSRPGAREWWQRNRQIYTEAFQQEVSRLLEPSE